MKKKLLLIVCCFCFNLLFSQIKGTVFSSDKVQLANVCVYTNDTNVGTVTNDKGEFLLNNYNAKDSVIFSIIGYKTAKFSLNQLQQFNFNISLALEPIQLQEAIVSSLNVKQIVTKAYKAINANYSSSKETENLSGVYRKQLIQDGEYAFLGEAFLCVNYSKWKEKSNHIIQSSVHDVKLTEVKLKEGIKIDVYPSAITRPYPDLDIFNDHIDEFDWEIEKEVNYEDKTLYQIVFKKSNTTFKNRIKIGRVFITKDDFAFVRIDLSYDIPDVKRKVIYKKSLINCEMKYDSLTIGYNFRKIDNHWRLFYSQHKVGMTISLLGKKEYNNMAIRYNIIQDFLLNNLHNVPNNSGKKINLDKDIFQKMKNTATQESNVFNTILPDYSL